MRTGCAELSSTQVNEVRLPWAGSVWVHLAEPLPQAALLHASPTHVAVGVLVLRVEQAHLRLRLHRGRESCWQSGWESQRQSLDSVGVEVRAPWPMAMVEGKARGPTCQNLYVKDFGGHVQWAEGQLQGPGLQTSSPTFGRGSRPGFYHPLRGGGRLCTGVLAQAGKPSGIPFFFIDPRSKLIIITIFP